MGRIWFKCLISAMRIEFHSNMKNCDDINSMNEIIFISNVPNSHLVGSSLCCSEADGSKLVREK